MIAFLPLYARHQGIANIASYFVLSGIASLTIRPVLGRFSDRIGHGYFVVAGFLAMMLGVSLIVVFGTLPAILAGGVLNAMGNATCSSAILGLAVDMAHPQRRGAAMGTFTISFQLGTGIGSILAGALVSLAGYRSMYAGALVILMFGLLLGVKNWALLSHRARARHAGGRSGRVERAAPPACRPPPLHRGWRGNLVARRPSPHRDFAAGGCNRMALLPPRGRRPGG